jgi:hypothetical protein
MTYSTDIYRNAKKALNDLSGLFQDAMNFYKDYINIKLRENFREDLYVPVAVAHTDCETEIAIRPREQIPYWEIGSDSIRGADFVLNHEKEHVLDHGKGSEYVIDNRAARKDRNYARSKVRTY